MPNYSLNLQVAPWKRAIESVERGDSLGVYAPYKRPAARPWMKYSLPLLTETIVLVCSPEVARAYKGKKWPAGFQGLRFGNNLGFQVFKKDVYDMARAGKITIDEAKTTEQNLEKLIKGRIDCYTNDRRTINLEIKRLKLDKKLILETLTIGKEQGYLGLTSKEEKFPYMETFVTEFNRTVERLRREGKIPPLE